MKALLIFAPALLLAGCIASDVRVMSPDVENSDVSSSSSRPGITVARPLA